LHERRQLRQLFPDEHVVWVKHRAGCQALLSLVEVLDEDEGPALVAEGLSVFGVLLEDLLQELEGLDPLLELEVADRRVRPRGNLKAV